jgi:hypothetical protein
MQPMGDQGFPHQVGDDNGVVAMDSSSDEDMPTTWRSGDGQHAFSDEDMSLGDRNDQPLRGAENTEALAMECSSDDETVPVEWEYNNTLQEGNQMPASAGNEEESLNSAGSGEEMNVEQLPMFPLTKPTDTTRFEMTVDVDSLSLLAGNVNKIAGLVNRGKKSSFTFCSNVNQFVDCTNKSRFLLASDKNYKPTVVNRKRKLFGLQMTKNLKIATVKVGNIDMVLSMHLLESNFVGNPYFTKPLLAAICLALNTALLNPEWLLTGPNEMEDDQLQKYVNDLKNVERFTQYRNGPRTSTTVEGGTGEQFLSFFQKALFFILHKIWMLLIRVSSQIVIFTRTATMDY